MPVADRENSMCCRLHKLFHSMERHNFCSKASIPKNGLYVLFEKNELAHGGDRIVRIGTHTGNNQLPSRLLQHFMNENKDRSIFRKNIGRAFLNRSNDRYLETWQLDLTTRAAKEKYKNVVDKEKQKQIENLVTEYIQRSMSFIVLRVDQKDLRMDLEAKIISTVSNCPQCKQSAAWLGNHSTVEKIRRSGLWQVNELYKEDISEDGFDLICKASLNTEVIL
jgi:hypothetical protein